MCYSVAVPGEWLDHLQESCDRLAQFKHRTATMIPGHGVMHGLPQPLDDVDPRAVGGLEQKLELRILRQPALCLSALVDNVVVDDEPDALGPPILVTYLLEQLHKQHRGLSVMFDPDQAASVGM